MLVRAYLEKHDFPSAQSAAVDLQTLRPDASIGYALGGLAAEGQKQLDQAEAQFEHALSLDPRGYDVLTALTRLQVARGESAKAQSYLKGLSERDPKAAPPAEMLGELYMAQGNPALALPMLTRAGELAPDWWVPRRNIALVKFAGNDVPGGIAAYDEAIKVAGTEPQPVVELAARFEKLGRIDDAIARYEAWNKQYPGVQMVANNLAMLLVTYKRDRVSLDQALSLTATFAASSDGNYLDTTGWVRFKRAEYAVALPMLQRAIERSPDSREIRYHLGMTELQSGLTDRAREDLETALSGPGTFAGSDDARSALSALKRRPT
jgi:tetratricopeptide (TPR) repeat protein